MAARVTAIGLDDALALTSAGFALARVCLDDATGTAMMDQALMINQNLAVGWANRGSIGVILGQHDAAVEQLTQALRLNPLDPEAYRTETMVAHAHLCRGRNNEGLAWALRALAHRPDYAVALWCVASGYAATGKLDQAAKLIPQVLRLHPGLSLSNLKDYVPTRSAEDLALVTRNMRLAGLPE